MNEASAPGLSRAAELRRAFDQTFAAPPGVAAEPLEDFLGVRVAGDLYALRVRELSALAKSGKIVPLPSRVPELLGLTGVRGALVPVYDLAALLGYGSAGENLRWLALCGAHDAIGLAFHEFEGHFRTSRSSVFAAERADAKREHVAEFVRTGTAVRAILNLPSVLAAVEKRAATAHST